MLGEQREDGYYIEGLKYEFPKRPPLKEIRNYGLPKTKQIWSRITDYEQFDWDDDWEARMRDPKTDEDYKQLDYFIEEVNRLHDGMWIFIGGEPTYINKYMYFFCQWFVLESGEYPEYRDSSLYYYRFLEICDKHPRCMGHTLLKNRRLGATSMIMSALLLLMITTQNKNYGMISKKGTDAAKAFQFAIKANGNLPKFLLQTQEGNKNPKKVLSFKEQSKRITKDQKTASKAGGLNNELSWESTEMNAYDGYALAGLFADETGKFPKEVPITKYLSIAGKCVKKGAKITGKIYMPTTVNAPQAGGLEYRAVWESSDQNKANYLGETESGIYRIMIPAYYGYSPWIGRYGESIWDTPTPEQVEWLKEQECPDPTIGAKDYLLNVRKQLENNQEALQEEIRQNPFNADEAFDSANDRCIFPNIAELNQREHELIDKLVEQGRDPKKDELGRRGWFYKLMDGKVKFVDDSKGIWYVHKLLPEDQANRFHIRPDGKQVPDNEEFGAGGLDPINSGDATVDAGSDACCIIRSRYSSQDPDNTGIPVAMLLGRMEDITKLNEQVYNGLIYYGVKMLAERSQLNWHEYGYNNNLLEYVYGTKRSDGSEVKGAVNQQNSAAKGEHAEVQVLSALHDTLKIPFIRLIRDRKNFNVKNRGAYDSCMADGFCLMAMKNPFEKPKQTKINFSSWLQVGKITTYR